MADFEPGEYFATDRIGKLEELRDEGVESYPHKFERTATLGEFTERYGGRDEISTDEEYSLAGRITGNIRDHGSLTFIDITDEEATVQLLFQKDKCDSYDQLDLIDRGDFIGATGTPILTQSDELSLDVSDFSVLSKALNHPPGPEGLSTKERIRNRTVAMWNEELRSNLDTRFAMIREMRNYLEAQDFVEVQTPILQNVYGGTSARPFTTHLNAKDSDVYLRIAKELYHKRMVVGGYERIFEIGKDFRNEDIDSTHNPEFTMMELYQAYADYEDMMELTEDMVVHVLDELNDGEYVLIYGNEELDFSPPWNRLTMTDAIEEYAGIDTSKLDDDELKERALEAGGEFPGGYSRGLGIMELFEELVEHQIRDATFIIDHPEETTPLCKNHREKDGRIERFEIFAAGAELGNSYTELNDPIEQGELFAEQVERRERGDEEAHTMDDDFLQSLAYGMPPTGGLGIGIDRLAMMFTASQSIKEVLPFPMVGEES